MRNDKPLKLAIAGLGTVGVGVINVIKSYGDMLNARGGRGLEIIAVCARDKTKNRDCDLSKYDWYDDAVVMAKNADVDIFIELVGGSEGIAKNAVEAALNSGKHVVTANKALIAHHGFELAQLAEKNNVCLTYEAAVAGGIPVIKAIREGLSANKISSLHGILNGTCNYIMTTMRETGRKFDDVLDEAQQLGYAEADPSFDIDGIDAAHKLAILSSLAFGTKIDFDNVYIEGIRHITPVDIDFAAELGYKIKLLGMAENTDDGIFQHVHPVMVPINSPIAAVEGVYNAVVTEGDFIGTTVMEGQGAGRGPTASAVIADIIDIAANRRPATFGVPTDKLINKPTLPMEKCTGLYYLRLMVVDKPGVMADITAALRDENVSLETIIQRRRNPGAPVAVVLTTHETGEAEFCNAMNRIEKLEAISETPRLIRIARFND